MLYFLDDMEGCAVQLDIMRKDAEISGVAGSSVGILGGVMSIAGVLLAPVTAGASVALVVGGAGLGVTSGISGLVTTVTERAVNDTQENRASEDLQNFIQDVVGIQACLDEVTNQMAGKLEKGILDEVKAGVGVLSKIRGIQSGFNTIQNATEIAEQAANGTEAMAQTVAGIGISVFGIGLNIYTICKNSSSLAKGEHSEASEFIRARAAILRSEVDCWSRMLSSLGTGMKQLKRGKEALQRSFRKN